MMSDLASFTNLLEAVDSILEQYDPGEAAPDRPLINIVEKRASQQPLLQSAIELASDGLERYPFNAELLWRRALAKSLMMTSTGEAPELAGCEADLRTILAIDPNHLKAGLELLEAMFTSSSLEDDEVAQIAGTLAARAEELLIQARALQIRALGYADQPSQAEELFHKWSAVFPDAESLRRAKESAESLNFGSEKT